MSLKLVHIVAFTIVMLGWILFAVFFLTRKKPPQAETTHRESSSLIGIGLQGLAYGVVWSLQRTPRFTSIVPLPAPLQVVLAALAVGCSVGSVALTMASIRTLGREWSYQARLVEGHRLVTTGPYSRVRHPIYTAMLAKLVATALVLTHWIGFVVGLILFGIGTAIRVSREESLLRTEFGAEYEAYARRVPAVLPRIGRVP